MSFQRSHVSKKNEIERLVVRRAGKINLPDEEELRKSQWSMYLETKSFKTMQAKYRSKFHFNNHSHSSFFVYRKAKFTVGLTNFKPQGQLTTSTRR